MPEPTTTVSAALSPRAQALLTTLNGYRQRFAAAADDYAGSTELAAELEALMADYSVLVTDVRSEPPFAELEAEASADTAALVDDLRAQSARCAAVMEKYRALQLLAGRSGSVGYFANVESCIAEEFGAVSPTPASKVLLVGSGSFPMTLLHVAQRTGATAVGVDVDGEAVTLGRRVVRLLGSAGSDAPDIALEHVPVAELPFTRDATHIVFSSTVAAKYDLLDQLHPLTRDDVVVAMRFGDGVKSLFNYPMQDVDRRRWRLAEVVRRQDQVFDIALYEKQRPAREER